MQDSLVPSRAWLVFVTGILVVAVLYTAQAVLVPIALAVLLTFLLAPVVNPLQRRIGRVPAVLLVAVLTFTVLGAVGWLTTRQLTLVVQELPAYRENIRQKIRDVRHAGDQSVGDVQKAVEDIRRDVMPAPPPGTPAQPVVVQDEAVSTLWRLPAIGPLLNPLATAGLVIVLVIFMLLERHDLRDRLLRLCGRSRLSVTTRAFDEAGRRVSRYLLVQSLINLAYGAGVGVGLWALGVPYPVLWAFLGAALRFIPYVGPWIAAIAPTLVALAVLEGWTRPLLTAGLFVGLELFTNMVLETIFWAGAAGISQVGLLVAVAFWTWLWGPLGLLMATPLTVCLVVLGKHIRGLEALTTLISDEPVLPPDVRFYQRLLASDEDEASDIVESRLKAEDGDPAAVWDEIVVPALAYAERDRMEGRLTLEEERALVALAGEIVDETAAAAAAEPDARPALRVLGCPAGSIGDTLALRILQHVAAGRVEIDVLPQPLPAAEVVRLVRERGYGAVCISDLPPGPAARARHLAKRLRTAAPDLRIFVGRWAPRDYADDTPEPIRAAGADHVAATLRETADELAALAGAEPPARPEPARAESA